MSDTTLTIRTDAPIGTISPRLYGHFAEHLGRCCYDGLWVGNQRRSDIPQQNGFRTDVLEALRALPVPMLRWPGGCYADHYHWRDGIGPREERPIRLGMSCGLQVEDDNSLGTHEFLNFCAMIGAEPYLAGNVGSGTPQELCDWLEYCNTAVATTLARLRAANGSPEPFGVKLWGVGNENWGCGGNYEAATYAREYVRYATMLRHVDESAELVVCGQEDAWNTELLATIGKHMKLVDHLSIHRYWIHGGPETDFSDEQYYALLTEAHETEDFVLRTKEIIEDATGGKHRIGIALDEWGVWHPEARPWGPDSECARDPVDYEQAGTLRDALATAVALEGFHRQCNVLTLANLAQIVNVLHAPVMTSGARMWLTPTYHVLHMHTPHIGATALPVAVDGGANLPDGTSAVSATASRTADGVAVTLTNRHLKEDASVRIACAGAPEHARGQLLAADSPAAQNSADTPDRVALTALSVARDGDGWRVELPAHSVATVVLRAG
ncbi:MAG TPA: alpha-L-arabinofuranosidase C-terminal domain-containing protein [Roseiflexaceae bacterium]|jgi:alpha-N-arabinofuranosidase|nr:alpha-L-arabinofuranosidase C-terminal domain-containing protein [Roseiflexaceae bacterium]